jgi:ADP-ribose pyrophosphatase YjhB (NUDIX family)
MKFNVRVYGILMHKNKVLLTNESRFGQDFTKFPGGGLEFGEGTKECLIREFQEEFSLQVEVKELFYINDFFQQSAFSKKDQILSIYYIISPKNKNFSPEKLIIKEEKPHWVDLNQFTVSKLTFPIDQIVAKKLIETKK